MRKIIRKINKENEQQESEIYENLKYQATVCASLNQCQIMAFYKYSVLWLSRRSGASLFLYIMI